MAPWREVRDLDPWALKTGGIYGECHINDYTNAMTKLAGIYTDTINDYTTDIYSTIKSTQASMDCSKFPKTTAVSQTSFKRKVSAFLQAVKANGLALLKDKGKEMINKLIEKGITFILGIIGDMFGLLVVKIIRVAYWGIKILLEVGNIFYSNMEVPDKWSSWGNVLGWSIKVVLILLNLARRRRHLKKRKLF